MSDTNHIVENHVGGVCDVPVPEPEQNNLINLYGAEYTQVRETAQTFEDCDIGNHYKSILCLKSHGSTFPAQEDTLRRAFNSISPYISNNYEEVRSHLEKKLCILPRSHTGRCQCHPNIFIRNNPTCSKIMGKIEFSITSTPGDDDYVFKNRDSKLHPIGLTSSQEKLIKRQKDPDIKLKCAVPLSHKTTPFMMATALIDWYTYIMNIPGVSELIDTNNPFYKLYIENNTFVNHKTWLINYFHSKNRKVFNVNGNPICVIIGRELTLSDLSDPTRDNRTDIRDTDIQMGHISSRCDNCYTVHGTNILMMSRRGNLLIGEHSFIEDIWIDELQSICNFHRI